MKNLSIGINAVLAVAVIVLFILHFSSEKKTKETTSQLLKFENDSTVTLPIAYVDVDSLLTKYNYAKDVRETLMSKSESTQATLNQRQKQLVGEQQEFQRKLETNVFLNEQRAQDEYNRIQKMASDLEQTAIRMDRELSMEQLKMNNQLADSVRLCILDYNKTANYEIIMSNSGLDNILFAKEVYDITDQILDILNSRYVPEKK